MGERTAIQWTWRQLPDGTWLEGYTWNPWWGCMRKSEGCVHCYAESYAPVYGKRNLWGPASTTERWILSATNWQKPLSWNKKAEKLGHRLSVFCGSMMDIFEENPQLDLPRQWAFALMQATPWLNWLLLTKRPENILRMVPASWLASWPDNVWSGCSVENQKRADERLPILALVPAPVRFVSYEPALEAVDFKLYRSYIINWIICGGESGQQHRPFDLDWARSARDQVLEARSQGHDCRYFFKQVGGKTHAEGGRDLDGRTWDEIPDEFPLKGRVVARGNA